MQFQARRGGAFRGFGEGFVDSLNPKVLNPKPVWGVGDLRIDPCSRNNIAKPRLT